MSQPGFYEDNRYCPQCAAYVPYLVALAEAYCTRCDQRVRLFSESDRQEFARSLARAGAAEQESFGSAFAPGER
jgi:uncharacterized paraquat-inducible protein A